MERETKIDRLWVTVASGLQFSFQLKVALSGHMHRCSACNKAHRARPLNNHRNDWSQRHVHCNISLLGWRFWIFAKASFFVPRLGRILEKRTQLMRTRCFAFARRRRASLSSVPQSSAPRHRAQVFFAVVERHSVCPSAPHSIHAECGFSRTATQSIFQIRIGIQAQREAEDTHRNSPFILGRGVFDLVVV